MGLTDYRDELPFEVERLPREASELVYLVPNKVKQTLQDYRESILLGSELYSFSVLNINAKVQTHQDNHTYYLEDRIHHNQYEAEALEIEIINYIKEFIK